MIQPAQIELAIDYYLQEYPDENERLSRLITHLKEDGVTITDRSNMRGHITTSMVVFSTDWQNVLLIKHKAYGIWIQPGGHYENPTTTTSATVHLLKSALRELEEETGVVNVTVMSPIPLDIDTHPIPARPSKNEGDHHHYDFAYFAVANNEVELTPQVEEVDGAEWVPIKNFLEEDSYLGWIVRKVLLRFHSG